DSPTVPNLRGLPKGAVSPLREYAALAPTRAAVVKGFAQALADRHRTTVWAWNSPYSGGWELDWERVDAGPTKAQVLKELGADPAAAAYASEITLCPEWGKVTRTAREPLEPDAAVILDTVIRADPCLTSDDASREPRSRFTRLRRVVSASPQPGRLGIRTPRSRHGSFRAWVVAASHP
ncbi:hypothetical protein, partial [Streptomyces sp. PSKA30]|uniref:hypothetical protein n=1 Tax=Streptomyces sp. PSKA30 TaxID=2874597 RepID=UPI001CD0F9F4